MWSNNGGSTWSRHRLETTETSTFGLLPTGQPETMAAVEGADGATSFPLIALHRSPDEGVRWEFIRYSGAPRAYTDWQVVRPDGSVLVSIQGWSDDRAGQPSARPRGPYESDGTDWAELSPVELDLPDSVHVESGESWQPLLQDVTSDGGEGQTLYVSEPAADGRLSQVYVSTDGGRSWTTTAAR